MRYPYTPEQTQITAQGIKVLNLPADGYNNHWRHNMIAKYPLPTVSRLAHPKISLLA